MTNYVDPDRVRIRSSPPPLCSRSWKEYVRKCDDGRRHVIRESMDGSLSEYWESENGQTRWYPD